MKNVVSRKKVTLILGIIGGLVVLVILVGNVWLQYHPKPLVYETIWEAASHGDWRDVRTHLDRGDDVNGRDTSGCTALHYAAKSGDSVTVAFLLSKGGIVNARTMDEGFTPLHIAVINGDSIITAFLLSQRADPSVRDNSGRTPLHTAVFKGDSIITAFLLSQGADPLARDSFGCTALFCAEQECVGALLLRKGVDIEGRRKDGGTALHWAVELGNGDMAEYLLRYGANIEARDTSLHTPLHVAALMGRNIVADRLIERGADVNAVARDGSTPLDIAIARLWGEEKGSNVDLATIHGYLSAVRSLRSSGGVTRFSPDLVERLIRRPRVKESDTAYVRWVAKLRKQQATQR